MKNNIYTFLILLLTVTLATAQNYNLTSVVVDKAIKPTASVATLGRYGNSSGVDNKGNYNTSLDFLNLQDGDLQYNLGVSYSSNPFKVNDWGGRLGMQWSDKFSSAIYRTIRGLPDTSTNIKVADLDQVTWNYSQFQTLRDMCIALENNNGAGKDGESDIFSYNIFGLTGTFVIVNGQVLLINYSEKVKIEVGPNFDYFIITLKNGDRYYYGQNNTIEYTTYDTVCLEESAPFIKQKTAWFLTKIENVVGTNRINFNYGSISNYYIDDKSETITIKNKPFSGDVTCNGHESPYTFNHNHCTRSKTFDTKYLINVSSNSFNVDFSYIDREDIMTEKLLDLIVVRNSVNTLTNKIKFNYQKLGNNNGAAMNWGQSVRYFLTNINIGKDFDQKYSFSYNNVEMLPARFSYGQDVAGIYNGVSGTSFLPEEYVLKALPLFHVPPNTPPIYGSPISYIPSSDRSSHFPESSYGLLQNIVFPTGGREKIFYEANTVIKDVNNQVESDYYGTRIKKIELWSNDLEKTSKEYFYKTSVFDSINDKITFGNISSINPMGDDYGGHLSKTYNAGQDYDCAVGTYGFPQFFVDTFYKISSNKIYDIHAFQGSLLTYETVTEVIDNKRFTVKKYSAVEDWVSQSVLGELSSYAPSSEYFWYANLLNQQFDGEIKNSQYEVKKITTLGYDFKDYGFINNYTVNRDYLPDFDGWQSQYHLNLNAYSIGKVLIPHRWYNNNEITETTILSNGNRLTNKKKLDYFDVDNFNNLKTSTETFADGKIYKTEYKYAVDLYSTSNNFVQRYMVGIPLRTTQSLNDIPVSQKNIIYSQDWVGHEMFLPYQQQSVLMNTINSTTPAIEADLTYGDYDLKGNLLTYYTEDEHPVTVLYGYNQTLPIIKVEGVAYSTLMNLLGMGNNITGYNNLDICQKSNADIDYASEQLLINSLETVRNTLSNYPVTTYTYDPLIGVTSITPPSGIREVYIYDTANRLKEIRQESVTGKLLKEFKYNYKP